jgi:dTMP kinase
MKGNFIVFEGVEGSGKTTHIAHAYQWLRHSHQQKIPVITTRQPGGTGLGIAIRQLLLEEETDYPLDDRAELLLYAADRAQHLAEIVQPQLEVGGLVLCDRYTDSTIAYQGYGRGLDLKLIEQINNLATAGLESNLTIWLDVDVEIGLQRARQRGKIDRMEKNEIVFHQRVQQGYQELAKSHPDRICRVDASGTESDIQAQIQEILSQYLHLKHEVT